MANPILDISDLCKSYDELVVLDHLNLEVLAGQRLAIIGPSGSGKSTLLRLVMTLERSDAGTIWIDGDYLRHEQRNGRLVPAPKAHVRRVRGKVGMVFQQFNLFPHMRVLDNVIEAPIHVLGTPKSKARADALVLLDRVGLVDKIDAYPGELSGGQKQRVAIARALAMQPKIMLFDEVTSALDPELVGEVQNVLRDLAREMQMTMLIVTHEISFAREVADRVAFFDHGRVLEVDTQPGDPGVQPQPGERQRHDCQGPPQPGAAC